MDNIRLTCSRIMELVGTAFVCGVVFLFIQMVTFDTSGIDRCLGELMWVSLIVLPTVLSVTISYFCHRNNVHAAVTGAATLVFAVIVLSVIGLRLF